MDFQSLRIYINSMNKTKKVAIVTIVLCLVLALVWFGYQPETVYTFQPDYTLLQNPLTGWATDARNKDISQPHTLVFAEFSWRDIESTKGVYDFSKFESDNNFPYWETKNVKIIIRLFLDYPQKTPHRDIPDWLYNEMNGSGTTYSNSLGFGFSPDYDNPLLLSYHKKLVQAMADRYDNNSQIAFVEIGSLGHWGEWNTDTNNGVKIPFASQAVCEAITNQYVECFKNKILMMRRPTAIAADNKMGLFNDSFGDTFQTETYFINWFTNGYTDLQTNVLNPAMKDFWMYAPSGGEVAYYPGEKYFVDSAVAGTLNQLKLSHTSWLGPSGPFYTTNSEVKKNLDIVQNSMGYKFYVSEAILNKNADKNGNISLNITMNNIGIAPFYYNWPIKLYLVDSDGSYRNVIKSDYDIRKLMPDGKGQITFTIPKPAEGEYKIYIGITEPTDDRPEIQFANKDNSKMLYIGGLK